MQENTTNEIPIDKGLEDLQENTEINTYLELQIDNQEKIINNQQRLFTVNSAILYILCLLFIYYFCRNMTKGRGY